MTALTYGQVEGWNCVRCDGEDPDGMVPVGDGPRGLVFACRSCCAVEERGSVA